MKKIALISMILLLFAGAFFIYLEKRHSTVITTHQIGDVAVIFVDHLPITYHARIKWWYSHIDNITEEYHIVSKSPEGMFSYSVYAFGKGYQKEGKEDRLCFDDIPSPDNCVDKNVLLSVMPMNSGDDKFFFDSATYIANKNGDIHRVYDRLK